MRVLQIRKRNLAIRFETTTCMREGEEAVRVMGREEKAANQPNKPENKTKQ